MLTVFRKNGDSRICDTRYLGMTWDAAVDDVTHILVDGDELDRVLLWGYPNHYKRVQYYFGDTARQILLNWI